jgi:hypothetical protein
MEKKLKKMLGRPRKIEGTISDREFARAGIVMSVYDESRKSGLKHSSAVVQTIEIMEDHYPKMRISETGVRRILVKLRPRKSRIILLFERSMLSDEERKKFKWFQGRLAALRLMEELTLPARSDVTPLSG